MGGVLRVLRAGMRLPLSYGLDAQDETILTRRQASALSLVALYLMAASYATWLRGIVSR